ncbi:unnamed protein product [Rotaria sp. Silwood2]|nr:unnamed protein product [Rotaria sp. Silwood2]
MESSSFIENMSLQVPYSIEYDNEDQSSRSSSVTCSNTSSSSSFTDDEWIALDGTDKNVDKNQVLLSVGDIDIIAQVLPNIVRVPWQDELTRQSNKNEMLYCCLGISPSQFRRLIPSKENLNRNTSHMAILYAQMAMQYTLEQNNQFAENNVTISLVVLIVDAIQKYNFAVFNDKQLKTGTALKYALEEGNRLFDIFTQARVRLSSELAQHVTIIRWNDICNEKYDAYVRILQQHMTTSKQFVELINDVVQVFIDVRKPNGCFTEQQLQYLREYVLNELPALIHGPVYNGHLYSIIIHPILSSNNAKNDAQRELILRLLNYVRHSSELCYYLNMIEQVPMCEIYDIEIPAYKLPVIPLTEIN